MKITSDLLVNPGKLHFY